MKNYLVFDIGASHGRALVAQVDKGRFEFKQVYEFENGPILAGEDLYWDVLYLFSQVKTGIAKAVAQFKKIESIAIDTWGCDFGMIDEAGRLIGNVNAYRDKHRYEHSKFLHQELSEEGLFNLSGGPTDRIMGIYQLFSLKYRNATEYKEGKRLLMVPDLLNYFLTGTIANEFTNATMTLMCDQKERKWSAEIIKKFGFDEKFFTPLLEAGKPLGSIRQSVCDELGIEPIPVALAATHDTASAVTGIPAVGGEEWAFMILGTWCITGMETEAPIIQESVIKKGFGNEGGTQGKNMLLKNSTGLWIIQRCHEYWEKEFNRKVSWTEIMDAMVMAADMGSYIDVDDARFGELQMNMPETIRQYCRETGQNVPDGYDEVARVFYQSLALKLRNNILDIQELTGKKIERLYMVGGGSKSDCLCQWVANAVGIEITAGITETTSVGNLFFQLIADGTIKNVKEGRKLCHDSYDKTFYKPELKNEWIAKYEQFQKVIKKN